MTVEIGFVIALVGAIVGILGYKLTRDKHIKSEASTQATQNAEMRVKLDNIATGVSSIQVDVKAQAQQMNSMNERIVRVEESSKSAHNRINAIEEKIS